MSKVKYFTTVNIHITITKQHSIF